MLNADAEGFQQTLVAVVADLDVDAGDVGLRMRAVGRPPDLERGARQGGQSRVNAAGGRLDQVADGRRRVVDEGEVRLVGRVVVRQVGRVREDRVEDAVLQSRRDRRARAPRERRRAARRGEARRVGEEVERDALEFGTVPIPGVEVVLQPVLEVSVREGQGQRGSGVVGVRGLAGDEEFGANTDAFKQALTPAHAAPPGVTMPATGIVLSYTNGTATIPPGWLAPLNGVAVRV